MISAFDLFKVGIGHSSSHAVGPMKAAAAFAVGDLSGVARAEVTLYGSLAWTGSGHAADRALLLGLSGETPDTVDPDDADALLKRVSEEGRLGLGGLKTIVFDAARDLLFDRRARPPRHPNTLSFSAFDAEGALLKSERWCWVGGGFVLREGELDAPVATVDAALHRFSNARDLLALGERHRLSIAQMIRANEDALGSPSEVGAHLKRVTAAMFACIDRGLTTVGELPGGLKVKRRAPAIHQRRLAGRFANDRPAHEVVDVLSAYAIAVNEENAAGGRVATAPTNGAAGVAPSVLRQYRDFCSGASEEGIETFVLAEAGYAIVAGGTDNHLMLVDLRPKRLTGKAAEAALGRAHITCNKNGVPFDTEKPTITSGVRLGSPAATTRGFGTEAFKMVGNFIVETLDGLARDGEAGGDRQALSPLRGRFEPLADRSRMRRQESGFGVRRRRGSRSGRRTGRARRLLEHGGE